MYRGFFISYKMIYNKITFLILFIVTLSSFAQNLNTHKWKNRILIIQSNTGNNPYYQSQLEEFKNTKNDFKERKLVLYTILNNQYKKTDYTKNTTNENWLTTDLFHKNTLDKKDNFKILLIGLDGGIKLNQNHILKKNELLNLIDAMPMRAAELLKSN